MTVRLFLPEIRRAPEKRSTACYQGLSDAPLQSPEARVVTAADSRGAQRANDGVSTCWSDGGESDG